MDTAAVLAALEERGSEQTRRIYRRHGAHDPLFGVKYGDLDRLARRLGTDHELGLALWDTGNHDARMLAAKIVDPARFTVARADAWVRDASDYLTAGAVADVVAASPVARSRADAWRDRRSEWVASAGWGIVARTCADPDRWTVAELRPLLARIRAEIHDRPNRVRHEMTMALISIALRSEGLRRAAISTAERIGPVVVDHGETSCTTPEPVAYIEKTVAYRQRRAADARRRSGAPAR